MVFISALVQKWPKNAKYFQVWPLRLPFLIGGGCWGVPADITQGSKKCSTPNCTFQERFVILFVIFRVGFESVSIDKVRSKGP